MSAQDHLGTQFKMHHTPSLGGHWEKDESQMSNLRWQDDPPSAGRHMIEASTGNNKPLGVLTWNDSTISKVQVAEKWQHKGMATQMYNKAKEFTPDLKHSDNRTDAGDAWAKSTGDPVPERVQDHPEWYR